ncbi:hypothetical protein OCJ37_18370 [Xanthomonas sp. AM6]|uniref:hypothetical protein n=1 Tax=Xanthomonas sp. AM6 TaxID=2982531 RepID=UPI0021DA3A57|nr:hypothetical protein [Xanthomonas sp. AM6]UYB51912.1 hypothetical protein OCJ37_18370 [Xanthomonas sp. AM6]
MKSVTGIVALLSMAACLGGCGNLGRSAEERINEAMPPSSEVLASKSRLNAVATSFSQDVAPLEVEYRARLTQRARSCSGGYEPSLFASAEDIRNGLTDKACFARADDALRQWLGLRRAGLLLAAPPLREVPKSPLSVLTAPSYIQGVKFAPRAGVAMLETAGKHMVVDIGSGQVVAQGEGRWLTGSFSPNGRLLVGSNGDSQAQVSETETGDILATFPVRQLDFHWVGDVGAIYEAQTERTGDNAIAGIVFLDFTTGTTSPVPMAAGGGLENVLPVPGKPLRYVLMKWKSAAEIELRRGSGGWTVQLLSEREMPAGGWRGAELSSDGTFAFSTAGTVRRIQLPSLQMSSVTLDPLKVNSVTTTPDTDRLILTGFLTNDLDGSQAYLYSLSKRTLAKIDSPQASASRVIYIQSVNRNAIIDGSRIGLVDQFVSQPPMDASAYLEMRTQAVAQTNAARAAQIQGVLGKLRAMDVPAPGNPAMTAEQAQMWARRTAILLASQRRGSQAASTPTLTRPGPLAEVGRTARIEAVGIYEGADAVAVPGNSHRTGTVHVHVRRSAKPIILALSSYEPVRWVLTVEPGAKLAAVLNSGYAESQVYGAGSARVYQMGRMYAYKRSSDEYRALDAEVTQWAGKPIDVFQGRYTGQTFLVGM